MPYDYTIDVQMSSRNHKKSDIFFDGQVPMAMTYSNARITGPAPWKTTGPGNASSLIMNRFMEIFVKSVAT